MSRLSLECVGSACPARVSRTRRRYEMAAHGPYSTPGSGACKALYSGSIPLAASSPLNLHNGRSGAIFEVTDGHRENPVLTP